MIADLLHNPLFVGPALAWLIAQGLKIIIELTVNRTFDIMRFFGSGGMLSSHSSTVCALVVIAATRYGFSGFEFPMAFFFAFIVMYDARGVRRETGEQAKVLNAMMDLFEKMGNEIPGPDELKELIGHTPLQVFAGAVIGVIIGLIVSASFGLI